MRLQASGFFDLQVNGFAGVDFNDPATTPEAVARALDAQELTGVTRCLPTLITSSLEDFARCARTVLATGHAAVAGLHMEGPYLAPEDGPRGAHPRDHARTASFDDFSKRQEAADGRIRLVTLAPEVPGALPLIERTARIADAVSAGATLSTHLGNGCATTLARHPNLLWAQLAEDRLRASLIVDGHHLPPETVKVMVRAKTPGRCLLVTDATMCAGCAPGRYHLGALEVELSPEGRVQSPGAATLAGSALTLPQAVANMCRFAGLSLAEALPLAAEQPAAYLGEAPRGRLELEWDEARGSLRVERVNRGASPAPDR
ncbi:MAG: N-acetylglucosamine-6-phosphate deacetylase [Acidobacteria bacterium]|nr:MAG: N-acetylglucosamine-6-phosphate deacetylase [Acidobacteriota bacterium]